MFGYSTRRPVRGGQITNNAYRNGHPYNTNCKNGRYTTNTHDTHYANTYTAHHLTTMGTTESLETCSYLCISSEPTSTTTCLSVVPTTDRSKLTVATLGHAL